MKKLKILKILSIMSVAAAGLLGVSAFKSEKKAESVNAASTTLYINHFNPGSDKGGAWSNFKYYLFGSGGNNGWPGQSFTDAMKTDTPNEFDEYQYKLTIDTSKYQSLVLTGNSDSSWGGAFAKTVDITISDLEGNGLYCGEHQGWQTDANVFKVGTYSYQTKTVYLYDIRGNVFNTNHYCHTFATGKTGTSWPGVPMTKVSGSNNLYSAEINAVLTNVIFNNNGGIQTETIPDIVNGDSFAVYPDKGYNKLTYDAVSFIDKYMKFETEYMDVEGTGKCKSQGWYSSAKTVFNNKTSSQRSDILSHEPTSYRLSAWARANGESLSSSNILGSRNISFMSGNRSNLTLVILISISSIGIALIGGYFFYKKQKEN